MSSTGGPFPGKDGWTDFKPARADKTFESTPLGAFLINAVLVLTAGVVGAVLTLLVVSRFAFLIGGAAHASQTIAVAGVLGFAVSTLWALKAVVTTRRQLHGSRRRWKRGEEDPGK